MGSDNDVLTPKALVIPNVSTTAGNQPLGAATGNIYMSGTKLYFCDGTNRVLITSA